MFFVHHSGRSRAWARRSLLIASPLLLAGCSLSLVESESTPQTTGSIAQPVEVQRPLPQTLAYSDANRIGQAASAILSQSSGETPEDWINVATGSSGTLEVVATERGDNCRPFSTIVTSVGGVHSYSGAICPQPNGRNVVQIGEEDQRS